MITKIETERFFMRHFETEDASALFEMESIPEVHTYLGKQPLTDINQMHEVIKGVKAQYKKNKIGRMLVLDKKTNELVGWSGLKLEEKIRPFAYYDIGYRFKPQHWGKGIATETALASLKLGFETLKLPEICGAADVENLASCRVLQKIGLKFTEQFTFEGTLCNFYRLRKEDWLANNS